MTHAMPPAHGSPWSREMRFKVTKLSSQTQAKWPFCAKKCSKGQCLARPLLPWHTQMLHRHVASHAVYHRAVGLVCGEHQHLCNLHMLGSGGSVERHVGNIVAVQRLYALIHVVGAACVAVEAYV